MAACGLVSAYYLMSRRSARYGVSKNDISDLTFWAMLGAVVGARMLYVIRFWEEDFAGRSLLDVFKIYEGGLVFFGGFAGAAAVALLLCYIHKWQPWRIADLIAPSLALGHAFGRIGCLLNGCCHGFEYSGPLSFGYPHVPSGTFPLQLFASLGNICICAVLLFLEKRGIMKKRLFLAYIAMYSIGRFCLEFGRGDYPKEQLTLGMTPAQITCLWLLPLTAVIYLLAWRFCKKNTEGKSK